MESSSYTLYKEIIRLRGYGFQFQCDETLDNLFHYKTRNKQENSGIILIDQIAPIRGWLHGIRTLIFH